MIPASMFEADRSMLLIVDMQERLLPALIDGAQAVERVRALVAIARMVGAPVYASEHCPEKLGSTTPALRALLRDDEIIPKRFFALTNEPDFRQHAIARADQTVILCGAETHVCVMQTAMGLAEAGRAVALLADGVASRKAVDREAAISRMARAGVDVTTAEAVAFAWLRGADHPAFRDAIRLIAALG